MFVVLIFTKPTSNLSAQEAEQFNRNLKNYNVKLQILNQNKKQVAQFSTAIADNNKKRRTGLMNLNILPDNQAMLFIFEKSNIITMWMKNTRIPLDMLFIDENDTIVNIKTNSTPYSLDIISSEKMVNKVLEINAGLTNKLGIKIGYKIKPAHK